MKVTHMAKEDQNMQNSKRILTFLCLGAQKSGTTSLHSIFRHHPSIFVPVYTKEPHFYDNDANYLAGFSEYILNHFCELGNEVAVGEITPSLLCCSKSRDRIFAELGKDIKFIVMLRHPVKRAISHYKMNLNWLWEDETFESAIRTEKDRIKKFPPLRFNYFGRSYYLDQILHYLQVFDRKQFHFILFEELLVNHQKVLTELFEFLGVKNIKVDVFPHANPSKTTQLIKMEKPTSAKLNQGGTTTEVDIPKGGWIINSDFHGRVRIIPTPNQIVNARLETIKNLLEQELPTVSRIRQLYGLHFASQEEELQKVTGCELDRWWRL